MQVMVYDLEIKKNRVELSTRQLEPQPGDMIRNRMLVYDKAEETAELFRRSLA